MTRPGVCRTMKSEGLVAFKFKKHSSARASSIAFSRVDIPCQVSEFIIFVYLSGITHSRFDSDCRQNDFEDGDISLMQL